MIIYAKDFGIIPEHDASVGLINLAKHLRSADDACVVIFENGTYPIDAEKLEKTNMFVTNTVGDNEWFDGETPHENRAGINLKNLKNITFDGNGARFVLNGRATNMALIECENVTVKNITFDVIRPDMHEFTVIGKGLTWVDFRVDDESEYTLRNGQYYFVGSDYERSFFAEKTTSFWNGRIDAKDNGKLKRGIHPFFSSRKVKEKEPHVFRSYDMSALRFKVGEKIVVFDVRRKYNGIFIDKCKNITLDKIEQNFNYGLALVAQDSDTLTFKNLRFMPKKGSPRLMASIADFIQICMCRGKVTVKDSTFIGAGDDSLNAHGIHFKITSIDGQNIVVRFMHPQSHGFNPLRVGDKITFVKPSDLICRGECVITESKMLNEYDISLKLHGEIVGKVGDVIEDIDASPSLLFENNFIDRIITRGLLLTIRGETIIRKNVFEHTTMNNILISDDAKNWYESGCVKNVLIEENEFKYCPQSTVVIMPENTTHSGAVHQNITIRNNTVQTPSYYIKSANGVRIYGNKNKRKEKIRVINSDVKY